MEWQERISVLRLGIAVALALVLVACSPAPTATPPPTPTAAPTATLTSLPTATLRSTATPTAAPTATLTPTPKPTIPLKEVSGVLYPDQKILQDAIAPYAAAFNLDAKTLEREISYRAVKDKNDNLVIVALHHLDSDSTKQSETFKGDYPLLLATKSGAGAWQWHKMIVDTAFRLVGKETWVGAEPGDGKQEKGIRDHYKNWIVTTSTEGFVYPKEKGGEYNFKLADAFVRQTPVKAMMGHLVWGFEPALPQWVIDLSPNELKQITPEHIKNVMGHFYTLFPEKQFTWTVVAEATNPTLFHNKLPYSLDNLQGSYIEEAFVTADKVLADYGRKNAAGTRKDRLAYSDFIFSVNDQKLQKIVSILKFLRTRGLIDEFHLQLRFVGPPNFDPSYPPSTKDLTALTNYIYEQTDVPVVFTEVEIDTAKMTAAEQEKQTDAIMIFANVTNSCTNTPHCLGITFPKTVPDTPAEITLFDYQPDGATPNKYYYLVSKTLLL
jgi:GH35 family endo-1,4-beta-xylanase